MLRSVGRYLALGCLQIQLAGAYQLVESPLERIFQVRVPGGCFGRLGPKVTNGIGSSQRQRNQAINFVVTSLVLRDSVLGVGLSFKGPSLFCVGSSN